MQRAEIVLPSTEPATEWVRGRALQKVSPTYEHGVVQRRLAARLGDWADAGGHGRVAVEWRFRIAPPGEAMRPLVPDVAFLSFTSLPADAPRDEVAAPAVPPTVAIEVLSPDDRRADVDEKIATYLAAGSALVLVVDPVGASMTAYDRSGRREYVPGQRFTHAALPDFAFELGTVFDGGPLG